MAYATEQNKTSKVSTYSVKLSPGRDVTSELSLSSGTTYTATLTFQTMSGLEVDASPYTKVTGTPSSGQFSYSNGTLLVNLGAALTTQVVTAIYDLYYTSNEQFVGKEFLDTQTGDDVIFYERLVPDVSVRENIRFLGTGIIESSASGLKFINVDNHFTAYTKDEDTYINREVYIYHSLNGQTNTALLFNGLMQDHTLGDIFSLSVKQPVAKLSATLWSNTNGLNSFFNKITYPNIHPSAEDASIPRPFQTVTKFDHRSGVEASDTARNAVTLERYAFYPSLDFRFYNVDYNSSDLEFSGYVSLGTNTISETVTNVVTRVAGVEFDVYIPNASKFFLGDFLDISNTVTGTKADWYVTRVESTFISVRHYGPKSRNPLTGDTVTRVEIPVVVYVDPTTPLSINDTRFILRQRDYTISVDSNGVKKITVDSGFLSGVSTIDYNPSSVSSEAYLLVRAYPPANSLYADDIKFILDRAGVDSSAISSFEAVESSFLYAYGERMSTCGEVLSRILKSNGLGMRKNSIGKYELITPATPSSGTEITEDDIIEGSFSQKITYVDLKSRLTAINKDGYMHEEANAFGGFVAVDTQHVENARKVIDEDIGARSNFDNVNNLVEIDYVREANESSSLLTDLKDRFRIIYGNRSHTVKFKTAVKLLNAIPGDNIKLVSDKLAGGQGEKFFKITDVVKSDGMVTITAADFLGE